MTSMVFEPSGTSARLSLALEEEGALPQNAGTARITWAIKVKWPDKVRVTGGALLEEGQASVTMGAAGVGGKKSLDGEPKPHGGALHYLGSVGDYIVKASVSPEIFQRLLHLVETGHLPDVELDFPHFRSPVKYLPESNVIEIADQASLSFRNCIFHAEYGTHSDND